VSVGVKLLLECVSDAWKALNLELVVNCQRTSNFLKTSGTSLKKAHLCT